MRETLMRFIAAILAALPLGAADRRFAFARLVPPLAALVLILGIAFAAAGYFFAHQADARLEAGQRIALGGAIETIRSQRGNVPVLGTADLRLLARNAGLADLKLETAPEPRTAGRSVQPLLSENGRITGWLSWQPQHPMTDLLLRWWPVAAVLLILLSALAWLSVWQLRRVLRVLEAAEMRAENFEHNDTLIGLPHHRHLLELLGEALASRVSGQTIFFIHMDINRFAEVNETLGHAGGDETLVAFAMRLRELLPSGAICGRYGGDEFAVVMTGTDADEMTAKIEGIVALLQRPYWVGGRAMKIETCAGFSQCPRDGTSRDALTRSAGLALRAAKERGRGLVLPFDAAMDRENSDRRFIEKELRRALASETLDVHYQPIVAADGARIVGVEALLRWNHPERGAIAPLEFVAVAEQIGLMGELGHFVMRRALADARRWPELSIAVNLSPLQVRDSALVGLVEKLLRVNAIAPARLLLEITEGVLIDEPEEAKTRLDALRALGVRIALDDFGTGYSSLAYLQRFAFDKLKIDKSFVAPLGRSGNAGVLVQAMVALGRALGMTVLAEGVETEEQRVLLRLAGCDEMQGFLFGKPSPGKTIDRIVSPSVTAADRAIASRL